MTVAEVRAEVAEAKLAAVEAEVRSWHVYETHDIGEAFHESVRDAILDILSGPEVGNLSEVPTGSNGSEIPNSSAGTR